MKTDARVRYTKKALHDALLKLMETKPIKQITVTEVCNLAQLNRATFYKHYQNCDDLLLQIENELIADYVATLKHLNAFDATELLNAVFDTIACNMELCRLLIFEHAESTVIKRMIDASRDRCIENWRQQLKRASDDELALLFTCLANGLMHVVIEGYARYDRQALIAFANTIMQSCLAAYV